MALLGSYIDVRTIAGIASGATVTYNHGLPASPDFVLVIGAATSATSVSAFMINEAHDATRVTLQNSGEGPSPDVRAIAIVVHSIIR